MYAHTPAHFHHHPHNTLRTRTSLHPTAPHRRFRSRGGEGDELALLGEEEEEEEEGGMMPGYMGGDQQAMLQQLLQSGNLQQLMAGMGGGGGMR